MFFSCYFKTIREAAKKRIFFSGMATKRVGGVKGIATSGSPKSEEKLCPKYTYKDIFLVIFGK